MIAEKNTETCYIIYRHFEVGALSYLTYISIDYLQTKKLHRALRFDDREQAQLFFSSFWFEKDVQWKIGEAKITTSFTIKDASNE